MKVWRAVGGGAFKAEGLECYSAAAASAEALFVAPSEEQAIAWAVQLWHHVQKRDIISLEVRCIRDRWTLEVIPEFQFAGLLVEFVPAGDGGFNILHHDLPLYEAVVLPSDISED